MKIFDCLLCISIFFASFTQLNAQTAVKNSPPDVLLAQDYKPDVDLTQYLVSEKYDGVRAIWNGKQLLTRKGNVIAAPAWFTKDFPAIALDGELWIARGKFDAVSGAVRKIVPIDQEWHDIVYLVFELPNASGTFQARAERIVKIVKQAKIAHIKAVKQFRVKDKAELDLQLKAVVKNGGEGLMLHKADAIYVSGRNAALLKLKPLHDAEAIVIAHLPGLGKYKNKLGALLVETPAHIRFKLGTGFSDAQRENPPKVGSVITYTYRDKTPNGKPRFASFLRVREQ